MKNNFLFYFFTMVLLFYSCKNKEERKVIISIQLAKDTVKVGNYVKSIAYLEKPFYENKNSKIVLFLEADENKRLKRNLSNRNNIPMYAFHNLSIDTFNRKWSRGYEYDNTVAFTAKFDKVGTHSLRGFVVEYYDKDPLIDSIIQEDKIKRYFFEKNVYVK
ncbi:hypothetical protein SAMN04488096_10585 [Mesonia phycicola]|uniref:Lipoprotein n=1 Tax=Mesonia phycicola TaxID=579105 RepID=A0A1M6EHQ1_9FLAO|nr:hypothetical protein [Mesonia phycicola]SHI84850.1 hypothetical protein SAMN04488096_10585 [Mesonia phycicola]